MNIKSDWIVCFGSKLSSPSVYTEKQLINRFYRDGSKILWINPTPHKNIAIKGISTDKSIIKKIALRLKNQLNIFSKVKKDFYQVNPLFLPNVEKYVDLNAKLLRYQMILFMRILRIKKFSLVSSGLTDLSMIFPKRNFRYFIQISGDLYSDLRDLNEDLRKKILSVEKRVFNFASIILAASTNIFKKIQGLVDDKGKVIYFPHGVEFDHFNNTKKRDLGAIKSPIAGYFGSLTENNDQRMFKALAESGYSVVLIGKILGDYSSCINENFHFIGPVDYKYLPEYAQNFDVCIMAWKPAEWINNSNPSKTLEYFAMGKPIVSNTIPELKKRFSELMYFADDPKEFVNQTNKALKENNDDLIKRRIEVAKNQSWEKKYNTLLELLKK